MLELFFIFLKFRRSLIYKMNLRDTNSKYLKETIDISIAIITALNTAKNFGV